MTTEDIRSFSFVDIGSTKTKVMLPEKVVSCNVKNNSICFSTLLSRKLYDAGFKYFRMAYNQITEEIAFVLSKTDVDGMCITLTEKRDKRREFDVAPSNLSANSKKMFDALITLLKLDRGSNFYLELSDNQSKRDDLKFYTVSLTER